MKKIFSILVLSFLVFFAKGQMQDINAFGYNYNGLGARKIFNIPSGVVSDTALSAAYYRNLKPGAMFYDSVNNTRYVWHYSALGNYWAIDNTGGGGGGSTDIDTTLVIPIGTASPMYQAVYASNNTLRVANFGGGFGIRVGQQSDSLIYYYADTTGPGGLAYKQWIINNYGVGTGGNIAGLDGVLAVNQNLTANRHAGMGTFTWTIDGNTAIGIPLIKMSNTTTGGTVFESEATNGGTAILGNSLAGGAGVSGNSTGGYGVSGSSSSGGIGVRGVSSGGDGVYAQASGGGLPLYVIVDEPTNNNTQIVAYFFRNYTGIGSVANGEGGEIDYQLLNTSGGTENMASVDWQWINASTKLGEMHFAVMSGGGVQTVLSMRGDGTMDATTVSGWINAANNAAAIAAGGRLGEYYRNGDVVQVIH